MKLELELTEREEKFLRQYTDVYDSERRLDITASPIVIVEDVVEHVTQEGFEDGVS